ncbi:TVP38/TMEM64 family protein [Proteobacteria bacterium 005FR1]|nr:TVP38/TMEM64 family protein [Proteobacteria bacterium 005FR1]
MSSRRKIKHEKETAPVNPPDRITSVPNNAPRAILALVVGLSLVVASIQMPEAFWSDLLKSAHFQSDMSGFVSLTAIYTVAILLMAPLSPFALAAGVLFGFWWGSFLALIALNVGAALAFLVARYLLRRQFAHKLSSNGKMAVLARAMRGDAVRTIAILRLNPVIPFNLQNYVCGATGVSFPRYAAGTFLGAAPFTIALVYLGHAGRSLVQVEEWTLILFGAGVLLTLPMTWALLRKTITHLRENNDNTANDQE